MLDSCQNLLIKLGPGMLAGVKRNTWSSLLKANDIDAAYGLRGVSVSAASIANSVLCDLDDQCICRLSANLKITNPLFIIGHWRSGTSHLYEIMTRDRQFAFPTHYQVFFPHACFRPNNVAPSTLGFFHNGRRMVDNVVRTLASPGEDEFATCIGTGLSPFIGYVFPRNQERYDKYLTLRTVSPRETSQWRTALVSFLKRVAWTRGQPLVLKSPTHTCRIKLLLSLFPDARFVHIYRHPYNVFRSTVHQDRVTLDAFRLQRFRHSRVQWIIHRYKELYDVFFEEKHLVPPDRLYEMRYEDLVRDPVGQLESLYANLSLRGFEAFRPVLKRYIASVAAYKTNSYIDLPEATRCELKRAWRSCFDRWNYPS